MIKWKTVFLIYIILFSLLVIATSYRVSSTVVDEEEFKDDKIASKSYDWRELLEKGNKTVVYKYNRTAYWYNVGRYRWTVIFKLEKTPEHYRVKYKIYLKLCKSNTTIEPEELNVAGVFVNLTFYVNGEEVYYDWADNVASADMYGWLPDPPDRVVNSRVLRKDWNNITVTAYAWLHIYANVSESVNGTASYILGPLKVTVGELKTVFGLQPDVLLPGAILILPLSVALEILTRKFRRKLKRIERIKY